MSSVVSHRPEIDGLRALAVLAVLLHHAGVPFLPGGYLGVDLFFVISGYVITRIIRAEIDLGTFSFRGFWTRRARRILPAVLVLLAVALPTAWIILTPDQMASFLPVFLGSSLMVPNIMLWLDVGYFAPAAETQMLLHLWSLGVEEQFYLLYPLIFVLLSRMGILWRWYGLGLLAVFSLLLAIHWSGQATWAGFYLLPSRAWELLAGGLAALLPRVEGRLLPTLLAVVGFEAILLSLVLFPEVGPGLPTLPLVVGAVLCLLTGSATPVARLLSLRPLTWMGKVSYGTYLWHLPLLAVPRILLTEEPPMPVRLALVALAVGLGWLSWRFVETPFRRADRPIWPTRGVGMGLVAMAALAGLGLLVMAADRAGWRAGGWPGLQPEALQAMVRERSVLVRDSICHWRDEKFPFEPFLAQWNCPPSAQAGLNPWPVAIYGDSIAADVAMTVRKMGREPLQLTAFSCAIIPSQMTPQCRILADRLRSAAREAGVRVVILANYWQEDELTAGAIAEIGDWWSADFPLVVVLGPLPLFPALEERLLRWPSERLAATAPSLVKAQAFLTALPADAGQGLRFIDVVPYFCGDRPNCSVLSEQPLMLDEDGHLTSAGAAQLARGLGPTLSQLDPEE